MIFRKEACVLYDNEWPYLSVMNTLYTQAYFLWQGSNVTIQKRNYCYHFRVYYGEKQVI